MCDCRSGGIKDLAKSSEPVPRLSAVTDLLRAIAKPAMRCRPMTGTLPADDILRTAAGFSPTAFAAAALPVSSPFLISRSIDAVALNREAPFELPQEQSVRSASDQVGLSSAVSAHRIVRMRTEAP